MGMWVAAATLGGLATWWAVGAIGPASSQDGDVVLTQAQVRSGLGTATAAPSARPGTGGSPAPSDHGRDADGGGTASAAAPVTRSWDVPGGRVTATCTGPDIRLEYASPQEGWVVEIEEAGPRELDVDLERSGTSVTVVAVCVDGAPTEEVEVDTWD